MFSLGMFAVYCYVCIGLQQGTANVHAFTDSTTVTLGVFPRRKAAETYRMFKPLASYLSGRLGRKVHLIVANDFKTFWHKLSAGRFDIVHFNQYHYLLSHKKWGYEVILKNEEFSNDTIGCRLYVRKDSGINKVKDLKGKKIVFGGGKKAMMSYIYPTYLLQQAGLTAKDYQTEFAINPVNAIYSTYYRQSVAAGAGNAIIDFLKSHEAMDFSQLKILAKGKSHAHLPWAVKKTMPNQLARQIQLHLIDLKYSLKGIRILQNAGLTGLSKATDDEYEPYREIVNAVFGEI